MIEELEKIVIEKLYFELSAQEKVDLQEWISSEEEFNQMKTMFSGLSMQKTELIDVKPSENLRARLAADFENAYAKKRLVWYNKLALFLWPAEKPWHRRPAFQIASVACLLVVAITVVPRISPENNQFAQELSPQDKEVEKINEVIVEQNEKKNQQDKIEGNAEVINELPLQEEVVAEEPIVEAQFKDANGLKTTPGLTYFDKVNPAYSTLSKDSETKLEESDINQWGTTADTDLMNGASESQDDKASDDVIVEVSSEGATAPQPAVATSRSEHPDGIYIGEAKADNVSTENSKSIGEQTGMLDLLTAAY